MRQCIHISWDKFKLVIHKFVKACENSQQSPSSYCSQLGKQIEIGLGAKYYISDYDKENVKI